jgi:hypothetical protein
VISITSKTHFSRKKNHETKYSFDRASIDGGWASNGFGYEILVQGKHIVLKIDSKTISDDTEPDDLDRPERCLSHGTFALQAHDPASKVYFKDLSVKRIPAGDAATGDASTG